MSTNVPAKAAPVSVATEEPKKLDDVLLAMDVVDTLRHREQIVGAELNAEARETQLIERLKQIYEAQGIQVPERILKDGVKALEEQRFVYKPPAPSFNTTLAKAYINRGRWLPALGMLIAIAAIGTGVGVFATNRADSEWRTLPTEIARVAAEDVTLAIDPKVDAEINSIAQGGQDAVENRERGAAKQALTALKDMRTKLGSEYDLRIVSREGEDTGFFRIPENAPNGRNYYVVVEAVAPGGRVLTLPVKDEETQKTERVDKWAQRVSKETYDKVGEDKRGDQIVQNDILGRKPRGELEPTFDVPVPGGAITKW
jgi:hypothetical protein